MTTHENLSHIPHRTLKTPPSAPVSQMLSISNEFGRTVLSSYLAPPTPGPPEDEIGPSSFGTPRTTPSAGPTSSAPPTSGRRLYVPPRPMRVSTSSHDLQRDGLRSVSHPPSSHVRGSNSSGNSPVRNSHLSPSCRPEGNCPDRGRRREKTPSHGGQPLVLDMLSHSRGKVVAVFRARQNLLHFMETRAEGRVGSNEPSTDAPTVDAQATALFEKIELAQAEDFDDIQKLNRRLDKRIADFDLQLKALHASSLALGGETEKSRTRSTDRFRSPVLVSPEGPASLTSANHGKPWQVHPS